MKTKGDAMEHKNKFTADAIRQLQQSLEEVAPYQATELSKQQAICALSPQILDLRAKGYSWTAVAALLSERGVPVSVAALRTYLRRVREEAANEVPRTSAKRVREGRPVARSREPPPPIASSPTQSRKGSPADKPQPSGTAPASTAAAQHATAPAPQREQEPRRSTFVPRTDTNDI
jgi:hypothetical protein